LPLNLAMDYVVPYNSQFEPVPEFKTVATR